MTETEKLCVVQFDEMRIKTKIEYNEHLDFVEEYNDLSFLGRTPDLANTLLVIMLRGICNNWKIPFAYFVSAGSVKSDLLKDIISRVVKKLHEITFKPLLIVCDQGSNSRKALKLLGASKEQPYICIENLKLYTAFDTPH